MQNQKAETYDVIPIVPSDFEGAVAVCKQAIDAINYWKERKLRTYRQVDANEAQCMIERWFVSKGKAHVVIQSFQLKLF